MRDDNLDYAAIRRQVEAELQQKRFQRQLVLFLLSGFIFLLFLVMVLLALPDSMDSVVINRDSLLSVVYFLAAGWVVALVFHALSTFLVNSPGWARKMRRRLTAQALEDTLFDQREGLAELSAHKIKRQPGSTLRLSDEGELLDIVEDRWQDDPKREERHA
ncbi:MAG: 2TM domain-containing protein [Chloroflexi bacterium]|nr:2TM domain-containing protein [Chloroflexota bacterium]